MAQVTGECIFPTEEPTLCDLYKKEPPREEIEIQDATFSVDLPVDWISQHIFINATFTVNSNFTISDSGIRFGPNGRLVVTTFGNLYSTRSRYFGCDGWRGIRIEGISNLHMDGNQVEDAQHALTIASDFAYSTVQNCLFNRNDVDIYVLPAVTANALIVGNVFDCTSNTFLGSRSSIGVQLESNSTLTFGLPTGPYNVVRNHLLGASANAATLHVRTAEFACNTRCGIVATLGRLNVRTNPALTYANFFKHNRADIATSGTILFVQASQFTECESDNVMALNNTYAQPITLSHNTFTIDDNNQYAIGHTKTAITIDRSSSTSGVNYSNRIDTNIFNINAFTINEARSAVRVVGYPGTHDRMDIRYNTVNVAEGGAVPTDTSRQTTIFNITVKSAEGFYVFNNTVNTQNTDIRNHSNRWGFYIHDWTGTAISADNKIKENKVLGTLAGFDYGMCALHFIKSGPWEICDNQSNFTLRGFHFFENCAPSIFGGNIMGTHRQSVASMTGQTAALLMEPQSAIGPQFCRHNRFTLADYMPDRAAWHKGNVTDFANSRFDYNPSGVQETPVPVFPLSNWFFINTAPPTCADIVGPFQCGRNNTEDNNILSEPELALVEQNQSYEPPANVRAWEARYELLAKLLRYPELKVAYPAADIFFGQHISTSAGQFIQWEEQMNQAMLIEPGQLEALQQNRNQVTGLTQELDLLDGSLTTEEEIANAGPDFFAIRAVLLGQIGSLTAEEQALLAAIEEMRVEALNAVIETLTALPQNTPYEQDQVFLNGLAVKKARQEAFSEEEYAALRIIATQCPDVAGSTRNQAINYLPVGDPANTIWERGNAPGCLEEPGAPPIREDARPVGLALWPNPTISTLFVNFSSPFSGHVQVFALTGGSVLWSANVEAENRTSVPTQQLVPGVYMLTTIGSAGYRRAYKFVVSKN